MHGFAGLRLVGITPVKRINARTQEDNPMPLPFPTCVRDLPIGAHRHAADDALDALEMMTFSFERLRADLNCSNDDNKPRAA